MVLTDITLEKIKAAIIKKGYVWFNDDNNKGYDVNVVTIRNSDTGNKVTNLFDDAITISFKKDGKWVCYVWMGTTDPGTKGVLEFHNPLGVAILAPGQYRSSHTIRKHQGKYDALCQKNAVKVFRDKNKNLIFDIDPKTEQDGVFGINVHHSNYKTESTYVENWSEGCQVFKKIKDFNVFMSILYKAEAIHGNSFTLTLLESKDL